MVVTVYKNPRKDAVAKFIYGKEYRYLDAGMRDNVKKVIGETRARTFGIIPQW